MGQVAELIRKRAELRREVNRLSRANDTQALERKLKEQRENEDKLDRLTKERDQLSREQTKAHDGDGCSRQIETTPTVHPRPTPDYP